MELLFLLNLILVESDNYELRDVLQVRKDRGNVIKKVYHLTPEAFKKCLMIITFLL
jgi:hypothetical protein